MTESSHQGAPIDGSSWARAHTEFIFERDAAGRTYIARQYVTYPFHITRPFYVDGDWPQMATLYLASASPGLLQGDRVHLSARVGPGAAVHLTTAAATKVHSMDSGIAVHAVELVVEPGGYLEYLVEPIILFPQSRLLSSVTVRIAENARVVIGESFLTHDPTGGDEPAFDLLASELSVRGPDGDLLVLDRLKITDVKSVFGMPGVIGRRFAQGSLYAFTGNMEALVPLVQGFRQVLSGFPDIYAGASALPNACGAYLRILTNNSATLRAALLAAWQACRYLMVGVPMAPRRK